MGLWRPPESQTTAGAVPWQAWVVWLWLATTLSLISHATLRSCHAMPSVVAGHCTGGVLRVLRCVCVVLGPGKHNNCGLYLLSVLVSWAVQISVVPFTLPVARFVQAECNFETVSPQNPN